MQKIKILLFGLLLVSTQIYADIGGNPFDKSVVTNIGSDVPWQYINGAAIKVAQDSLDSDTYYHLAFNGKSLRLSLSSSPDTTRRFRHFDQFAVNDVKLDGQRLPLFQWCLSHQAEHDRFLQQGLTVDNGVCENRGQNGTFIMNLNSATLAALESGKTLSFVIKPFRTTVIVNYSLSDFTDMANRIMPAQAAPAMPVTKTSVAPATEVHTCKVNAPTGFETVKAIEYKCGSVSAETAAHKSIHAKVEQIKKQRAEEKARKEKEALAKKQREEEAQRQLKLQQEQESAAIAASKIKQEQLSKEITTRMVAMCKKMWAQGESRCYCENYIDQAPPGIKPNPNCKKAN